MLQECSHPFNCSSRHPNSAKTTKIESRLNKCRLSSAFLRLLGTVVFHCGHLHPPAVHVRPFVWWAVPRLSSFLCEKNTPTLLAKTQLDANTCMQIQKYSDTSIWIKGSVRNLVGECGWVGSSKQLPHSQVASAWNFPSPAQRRHGAIGVLKQPLCRLR